MKIGNLDGRATIITDAGLIDIERSSRGKFSSSIDALISDIDALRAWFERTDLAPMDRRSVKDFQKDLTGLRAPIERPRQIFVIGLNYNAHTEEVSMDAPKQPMVFTKFASAISGPGDDIILPEGTNDWEVEMVAVMGKGGRNIGVEDALSYVAGYCIGQDISERTRQLADAPPQFSLAKSHKGFAPIGPWLTTADEIENPQNLNIGCMLDAEVLQDSHTSMMMYDVKSLICYLSSFCELYPGDLIFTGTPEGVGFSRNPPRQLERGRVLTSQIEGLGTLRNRCV